MKESKFLKEQKCDGFWLYDCVFSERDYEGAGISESTKESV